MTAGVWPAVGGSILVAIFNGGPPGVIYEFIVVSVFYWLVAASLAELASAIPSSAGVVSVPQITPRICRYTSPECVNWTSVSLGFSDPRQEVGSCRRVSRLLVWNLSSVLLISPNRFYAGYWNWLAWVFGAASMSFILGPSFQLSLRINADNSSKYVRADVCARA